MAKIKKMMYEVGKVDTKNFFSFSHNIRTWAHPVMLIGNRLRTGKRKHFSVPCVIQL